MRLYANGIIGLMVFYIIFVIAYFTAETAHLIVLEESSKTPCLALFFLKPIFVFDKTYNLIRTCEWDYMRMRLYANEIIYNAIIPMEIESIQINTTKEKFFLQYLILKRPVINSILTKINGRKTVLNDIPMHVLAELLFLNDKYSDLSDDKKWAMIFSRESRDFLTKKLRMEKHYLYVYFRG